MLAGSTQPQSSCRTQLWTSTLSVVSGCEVSAGSVKNRPKGRRCNLENNSGRISFLTSAAGSFLWSEARTLCARDFYQRSSFSLARTCYAPAALLRGATRLGPTTLFIFERKLTKTVKPDTSSRLSPSIKRMFLNYLAATDSLASGLLQFQRIVRANRCKSRATGCKRLGVLAPYQDGGSNDQG